MGRFTRDGPRQLPLGFGPNDGHAYEDLVIGQANEAPAQLLAAWPDWPSPVVVLCGPEGSGKTHLARIWRAESGAAELPRQAIGAAFSGTDKAVLIEDLDAGPIDEEGLFHLINTLRAEGGSLLLTARHPPATWEIGIADLASRLRAATLVEIGAPDDDLLSAVIVKLFSDRQVDVDPAVVTYMTMRMNRSLAEAMRLVERMDALSLERKCRITRALAAEALAEE